MAKKKPVERRNRRIVSAALREQGLLFRCGQGAVQDLLARVSSEGQTLTVLTATGAFRYAVPQVGEGDEITDRPLRSGYECPCFCGAQHEGTLAMAHRDVRLFTEAEDGTISQAVIEGHRGQIFQIHFNGEFLLSVAEDENLRLFKIGETTPLREIAMGAPAGPMIPLWENLQAAVGFADGRLELWDLKSGLKLKQLANYPAGVGGLWKDGDSYLVLDMEGQLWRDGERFLDHIEAITAVYSGKAGLFVGTELGEVHCLTSDGTPVAFWEAHGEAVTSIVVAEDGSWMASATPREPRLWFAPWTSEEEAEPVSAALQDWQEEVMSQAISSNGRWIACGGGEGQVSLRSLEDGRNILTFEGGHSDGVTCMAFRPDDTTLATGSADGLVLVWDTREGDVLATLDGHDEAITALLFEPSGQVLISGSSDGLITLWHPDTEQPVTQLTGFDSGVVSLTIARRGESLIAHYEGGHCLAWDLTRWLI